MQIPDQRAHTIVVPHKYATLGTGSFRAKGNRVGQLWDGFVILDGRRALAEGAFIGIKHGDSIGLMRFNFIHFTSITYPQVIHRLSTGYLIDFVHIS